MFKFLNKNKRKTFKQTISHLETLGLISDDKNLSIPEEMPQFDDEIPAGISFFRTTLADQDLSSLNMMRSFFSKSKINNCKFLNTNLTESNLCWNNFKDVNFEGAQFIGSDLRASKFTNVNFSNCDLSGVDLRRSTFKRCNFEGAKMDGAKINSIATPKLPLSAEQKSVVAWQAIDGLEPRGG